MTVRVETGPHGPVMRFPVPFNVAAFLVDRHVEEGRGEKVALRTLARELTYGELRCGVNRYGNVLTELGLARGDRLVMVINDCPEFFFLFWGAVKAGITPIPLNVLFRAADFEAILRDAQPGGIVYAVDFAAEVEKALNALHGKPRLILPMEGRAGLIDLADRASGEMKAAETRAEDDCYCLYSSGTTGRPKGVPHSHNDVAVCCQFYSVDVLGAREDDVFFSVARLFFSYGVGVALTAPLWVGGTAVLDERRPTPQTVLEIFRRCRPSIFAAVPTFYAKFLASSELRREDVPRLRRCITAAEPMPPELHRRWLEATGVPVLEGIGSTEAGHVYISNRMDDMRPGTLGRPVPGYQVRIVDEAGNEVSGETPGRLLVKGPSVLKRYWNDPERTARALKEGWFDSGDTFIRDSEGRYVFCGRGDDMLKVSGRWVSPFEIESALAEHPKILEAAVVGRPDENGLVKAESWVVLRNSADASPATGEEIRAFCKSRLAPYKAPAWVYFVEQLPKTATGKIQRYKLRAALRGREKTA